MLNLLRKYQKGIFAVVTVMIIASFAFFGTFSTLSKEQRAPEKVIGKAVDGSAVKRSEIDKIIRFISSDRLDHDLVYSRAYPNLLNDGVIRGDFLTSDLGKMLAHHYFDVIAPDLETRLKKMQTYRPYIHPHAPFISAENVWGQFMPTVNAHIEAVKNPDIMVGEDLFDLFLDLYADQAKFSTHMLRQFLGYQEAQYSWVPHDPQLDQGDLSFFRNHSLEDWFGPRFIEIAAQFIHNAAIYAKEEGCSVSYAQARADLMKKGLEMLQVHEKREHVTPAELSDFMQKQLAILHLDEKSAVEVWQKVMLMRTFLNDVSGSVFLDPSLYEDFQAFATEELQVDHYALRPAFQLKNNRDMFKLEVYLDLISEKREGLGMPTAMRSVEQLKEEGSPLVEYQVALQVASVTLDDLACDVGVKETWEYESAHFDDLKKAFSPLATSQAETFEERLNALEALDDRLREEIDQYARVQIVKAHPEWIEERLQTALSAEKEVHIPLNGAVKDLPGISDASELYAQLKKSKTLSCYSQDDKHFYAFERGDDLGEIHLLAFDVASDLLDKFVDERGESSFDDLITSVQSGEPEEAYRYRLMPYMAKARQDILIMGDKSRYLGDAPWHLKKENVTVERRALRPWIQPEAFDGKEKSWSKVDVQPTGLLSFYQIREKCGGIGEVATDLREGQKLIGSEVKSALTKQILDRIEQTQAIHLSLDDGSGES